jgi:5-methyltetrahydrofolate--homocysteine methyltransferase
VSDHNLETIVSSATNTVTISRDNPVAIIGERINPTGRKKLMAALQAGDMGVVRRDASAQVKAGAAILDVNAGLPGGDEVALMLQMLAAVREVTDVPLCIDSPNPEVLETALHHYEGKALINSVNGEERSLETVLPLVAKYNAAVIGLTMDDDGIPQTAEKRLEVASKIIDRAARLGIPTEDVIIDPLVLAVCTDAQAAIETLQGIRLIVQKYGVNITMGASNVSHGLPNRSAINAAFMAMSIAAGLTCPITNPLSVSVREAVQASDLILGRDEWAMNWITSFRNKQKA